MSGKYDSVLVWLHGLGDSADGFVGIFKAQKLKKDETFILMGTNTKVVLLTAKHNINKEKDLGFSWFT